MTADPTDGHGRAWGWLAHLRSGGTTPWIDWKGAGDQRGPVPGAQQLELLRRLNLAGRPSAGLVSRVLGARPAGRGSPDLGLLGADDPDGFGPKPVDPARLPAGELLRIVTSLVAEDLAACAAPVLTSRRPRPWRSGTHVVGDPLVADPLNAELARRGRSARDRSPVVVAAAPLARLLADLWLARCFSTGAPPWGDWLSGMAQKGRLPPRIDLARIVGGSVQRVGVDKVTVLLDPAGVAPRLRLSAPSPPPPADAGELGRRVAAVLGVLVTPDRRARLLDEVLRPRLAGAPGPPPGVPPEHADWVAEQAGRLAELLSSGDYAVVGDPHQVLPAEAPGAIPSVAGALDLGIAVLLEGLPGPGRRQGEASA